MNTQQINSVNWKLFFLWVVIVLMVAGAGSYLLDIGFWPAAAIVAAALVINGIVAEIEDRVPGGFLRPKDDE
jgi:hypothetical protein